MPKHTDATDPVWGMISRHEGGQKKKIYPDSKNNPTVATGVHLEIGLTLPDDILDALDAWKKTGAEQMYDLFARRFKWPELCQWRRGVVLDMLYALGPARFLGFRQFINAVRCGAHAWAAAEIIDSKWHRELVRIWKEQGENPNVILRTDELARVMRTGEPVIAPSHPEKAGTWL